MPWWRGLVSLMPWWSLGLLLGPAPDTSSLAGPCPLSLASVAGLLSLLHSLAAYLNTQTLTRAHTLSQLHALEAEHRRRHALLDGPRSDPGQGGERGRKGVGGVG